MLNTYVLNIYTMYILLSHVCGSYSIQILYYPVQHNKYCVVLADLQYNYMFVDSLIEYIVYFKCFQY